MADQLDRVEATFMEMSVKSTLYKKLFESKSIWEDKS